MVAASAMWLNMFHQLMEHPHKSSQGNLWHDFRWNFFSVLSLEHNSKQTKNTTGGCTLKNQSDLFMCNSKITIRDLFYQPLHWKIDISTLLDVTPNDQWSHWLHKNTGLTQQISSETHLFMEIWYRNSLWTTRCIWTSTRGLWFRLWPRWWKKYN